VLIVPYVEGMLHPKTALTPGAEFVELPIGDPYAYWRLIRRLYDHGQDWMIVEQDILITAEQIDSVNECPEPWCVYGYHRGTAEFAALGVLRLRREVMAAYPSLLVRELAERIYFDQCDGTLYGRLNAAGYTPHRHYPNVGHEQSAVRVLYEWKVSRDPTVLPVGSSTLAERGENWAKV
jgi:hypothetical protein